ncbi:MAG: Uncharacterised protein [Formosa sp. Hel1_33_131]|nr:MAG: Uncharacterised protein [Formosa sp. Hel1_33_131]|tara:strand:- start:23380 stop:24195 length:816 start_codon:yes stop_codon:yes gene_type:complete
MNTSEFTYLLHNPSALDKDQVGHVAAIIEEFPYFQSARAIYLKGLKDLGSFKYNQELKTTAAFTTDRSVLFDFITSEIFVQNDISTHIKQNFDQIKTIKVSEFQDISSQTFLESDLGLETAAITSKTLNEGSSESILELGKPLSFEKNETFSFSEWLRLTQKKAIVRSEASEPTNDASRNKKFALIDAFISNKPKLKPVDKNSKLINIAEVVPVETEDLMTETLARIYVEQKNYDKAIQSYRILSLKYPEKSSLFADQIQSIKVLKEKNNI